MTLSSSAQTNVGATSGDPAAIVVTEVAALQYPADRGYEYRGLLRSRDPSGTILLETPLQARGRPEWLVNVRHPRASVLELALLFRPVDTLSWREVGQVALRPGPILQNASSVAAEIPLPAWDEAPELLLRIRLSAAPAEEASARRPFAPALNKPARLAPPPPAALAQEPEPAITPEALRSLPPLSPQEEVIVKDVWNKLLAFQDLLIEMFVQRLLHEEPELIQRFGDALADVPERFARLFDQCVRRLQPHTEQILRESYRGVYPAPPEGEQTVAEHVTWFADRGMRPQHWLTAHRVWAWMLPSIPYLEEYDRENLSHGPRSALWRFFDRHVLPAALEAIRRYDAALPPEMKAEMRRCGDFLTANEPEIGVEFYRMLFEAHPEVLPFFGQTDVNRLAANLMQSFALLVRSLDDTESVRAELRDLAARLTRLGVPPEAYPKLAGPMLALLARHVPDFTPELGRAWETQIYRIMRVLRQPMLNRNRLLARARDFLEGIAREQQWEPADYERRWAEIEEEVRASGAYTHTYEELAYGAQVAWRNASKCIGRISWHNLIVRDLRHVTDPDEMFRECVEHVRMATNNGNLQIVMNVFRPKRPGERWGPRVWNSQYIRYAGYAREDGTTLGDGANRDLTAAIQRLGWRPPEPKGRYDILPLVIEAPGHSPKIYELPREEILEVPIEHPTVPAIGALGLKWCAIPAIANFRLEIGGIDYGCVPFNGWFMETEIARDLWEEGRYNQAEAIAGALGLDTSSETTLWRDRAFLELNVAVLHSFSKARVTLVDHQTASRQFLTHDLREKRVGRECPAQWSWVMPPAGGSTTPVWHHEMRDFYLSPQFHYAADKWAVIGTDLGTVEAGEGADVGANDRVLILYGSETGTAEGFARQTARRLKRYHPRVMALDDYDVSQLGQERLLLAITSTFGEGDMPGNGRNFLRWLRDQPPNACTGLSFAVMALGSTVYPDFCAAGVALERALLRAGGSPLAPLHKGDEIKGQADTFRRWLDLVARRLGEDPTRADAAAAAAEARLRIAFLPADAVPAHAAATPRQLRLPGVEAPVVANRELLGEVVPGSRSTRFLAFDISGTDMTYETGDHVAVYPRNPAALVRRLCDRLGLDPDAWFTTALVDANGAVAEGDSPYPEPVTVAQVLTEDLDLSFRDPFEDLIVALHDAAEDRAEKDRLGAWAETLAYGDADDVCVVLKEWLGDVYGNVADLLDAFPSATLRLEQLIELLPRQKPRFYSIASCPLVHPRQIHVTVGVVQVVTEAGMTRQGLCSNYLAGLVAGASARISVRPSRFRPPRDIGAPMLLVGPGTGVSPLIGFLQHREALLRQARGVDPSAASGPAVLYFGCRTLNDFLYRRELEAWHDTGVLTYLDVAFSRRTERKVYVQHRLEAQRKAIWELLSGPDCHFFICGDAKMSDDVFEVLLRIARTEGGHSHAQAVEFFEKMRAENRFVTDVWGVQLHFKWALAEIREAKYSQGERWLQHVTAG